MDYNSLLTGLTAIAAITAPVLTTWIQSHSALKQKQMEFVDKGIRGSVNKFAQAYANLSVPCGSCAYHDFVSAAYNLIADTTDKGIQNQIVALLKHLRNIDGETTAETDKKMEEIMIAVSEHLPKL